MRITNNIMIDRSLRDINANRERMARTQLDISSGITIRRPSDDPSGANRTMVLRNSLDHNEQYRRNMDAAQNFLEVTEASLDNVTSSLQRVRELAVQGANGTYSQVDRDAIAKEVRQIREHLLTVGNTQVNGRYVFSGQKTQTLPYPAGLGGPNNAGDLEVEIGPGVTFTYNIKGVDVFGDTTVAPTPTGTPASHMFEALDDLDNYLTTGNLAAISNDSIGEIDRWITTAVNQRTELGSKINRLEMSQARLTDVDLSLAKLLNDTQDTDIAKASIDLAQQEASLKAALSVGARVVPMSLVDFLR